MAGQTEFLQAIQELERLGETNGNQLSMEEINAYFSDMKLEEKQLDFICNYFESHQIYITNRIERQEEEIGDEELPNKEDPMDAEIVAFYLKEMEKAKQLSGEQEMVIARKLVSRNAFSVLRVLAVSLIRSETSLLSTVSEMIMREIFL
mgnify:CR=1 FL=1